MTLPPGFTYDPKDQAMATTVNDSSPKQRPLIAAVTHDDVIELLRSAADEHPLFPHGPSLIGTAHELGVDEAVTRQAAIELGTTDPSWGGLLDDGFRWCLLEAAQRLEEQQRAIESYDS